MDVGDALRSHVEERIANGVPKYIDRATGATVVISKHHHVFSVDIVVNTGTHEQMAIKASADGTDAYGSFDAAADKIEKQLRRYKRKLKDHQQESGAKRKELLSGTSYVIDTSAEDDEAPDNPLVIAENSTPIETLSLPDAVMRLDLGELPALVFVNETSGQLNVIYRRSDGNVAWVDPELSERQDIRKSA